MKIICLNTWGARAGHEEFFNFIKKYADYAFVSEGIKVKDFKVLPDEVSDHSALYIGIE